MLRCYSIYKHFCQAEPQKIKDVASIESADFANISYGMMKVQQRTQLHAILQTLRTDSHGRDLIEKLKDAVTNKPEQSESIKDNELEGGMVVNRWALMIESYVHPSSRDELTKNFTKMTGEGRSAVLTEEKSSR